jgi:hypothetical protein
MKKNIRLKTPSLRRLLLAGTALLLLLLELVALLPKLTTPLERAELAADARARGAPDRRPDRHRGD